MTFLLTTKIGGTMVTLIVSQSQDKEFKSQTCAFGGQEQDYGNNTSASFVSQKGEVITFRSSKQNLPLINNL